MQFLAAGLPDVGYEIGWWSFMVFANEFLESGAPRPRSFKPGAAMCKDLDLVYVGPGF